MKTRHITLKVFDKDYQSIQDYCNDKKIEIISVVEFEQVAYTVENVYDFLKKITVFWDTLIDFKSSAEIIESETKKIESLLNEKFKYGYIAGSKINRDSLKNNVGKYYKIQRWKFYDYIHHAKALKFKIAGRQLISISLQSHYEWVFYNKLPFPIVN